MRLPKYWPPTPSSPGECVPPVFGAWGGHTCWVERGVGGQYFGRRRHSSVLYISKYFVLLMFPNFRSQFNWQNPPVFCGLDHLVPDFSVEVILGIFPLNTFFLYLPLYGVGILELWPRWEAGCWGSHISHQSEWNPPLPCRGQGGWGKIQMQGKQLFSPQKVTIERIDRYYRYRSIDQSPLVRSYRKEIHVFFFSFNRMSSWKCSLCHC